MLRRHPASPVLVVVGALLQRPGLLQQAFLRVDQHLPSLPALGHKALGPQQTALAHRTVVPEGLQTMYRSRTVGSLRRGHDGTGGRSGGTGATSSNQVYDEVRLGETLPVGTTRCSRHQLAPGIGENLAGAAVAVSGSPMASTTGTSAPASLCSTNSSAPRLS